MYMHACMYNLCIPHPNIIHTCSCPIADFNNSPHRKKNFPSMRRETLTWPSFSSTMNLTASKFTSTPEDTIWTWLGIRGTCSVLIRSYIDRLCNNDALHLLHVFCGQVLKYAVQHCLQFVNGVTRKMSSPNFLCSASHLHWVAAYPDWLEVS